MTPPETRARNLLATELLKDGYHERAERVAAGNECMSDEPAVRACVEAAEAMREEAAKVAEDKFADPAWGPHYRNAAQSIAFAIRAIGDEAALALPSPVRQGEDGEEAPWIVWSNEHSAFWRANRCGYTGSIEQAGRYTRAEAEAICRSACPRSNSTIYEGTPPEICMPAPEALSPVRESVLEEAANAVENLTTDGFGNWASWAGWNNAKKFAAAAIRALKSDPDFTGHIDCPEDEGGRG